MPKNSDKSGYIFLVKNKEAFTVDFSPNPWRRLGALQAGTHLDLKLVNFYALPQVLEREFNQEFKLFNLRDKWYSIDALAEALAYLKLAESSACEKIDKPSPTHLTGLHRQVYILNHLDLKPLIQSANTLHRYSPELQPVIEFGSNPIHAAKLGFTMPVTTAGPDKGKPDPIRYLGRLLDLYDRKLELVDQPKVDGERRNNYRIVKAG